MRYTKNKEFKDIFVEPPILCFRRNKNLKDFLGGKLSLTKRHVK